MQMDVDRKKRRKHIPKWRTPAEINVMKTSS